jgi:hypothetical protein
LLGADALHVFGPVGKVVEAGGADSGGFDEGIQYFASGDCLRPGGKVALTGRKVIMVTRDKE